MIQIKTGDKVRLAAIPEAEVPEEVGEVLGQDGEDCWMVQVEPADDNDDGLRGGVPLDQIIELNGVRV